jgi:Protein of unknown function (DUF559)
MAAYRLSMTALRSKTPSSLRWQRLPLTWWNVWCSGTHWCGLGARPSYPKLKLIIEYDGWQHRLEQKQWSRDLQRREWLESRGWRIIVINSDACYGRPVQTLVRIRAAMVDRGHPGLPLRQPAVWTRQFVRLVR